MSKQDEGVTSTLQFSKKLTERRNNAMKERKRLKDNKLIISGYIEYPATLIVKNVGDQGYRVAGKF